jgi:hypothetical protein
VQRLIRTRCNDTQVPFVRQELEQVERGALLPRAACEEMLYLVDDSHFRLDAREERQRCRFQVVRATSGQ